MKDQILKLTCKKHIKIFKLHQLGLSKKDIATSLSTNVGHVYNVIKDYGNSEEKVQNANALLIEDAQ